MYTILEAFRKKPLLTLCIALFLQNANCHEPDTNQCKSDRTIVRVFSQFDESHSIQLYDSESEKDRNKTSVAYGTSVVLYCFGDVNADRLSITRNGEKIRHRHYDFSIGWRSEKVDLQLGEYNYACYNDENGCTHSIVILVTPGLEVTSTNIQIDYIYDEPVVNYTVQYGESMSVLCSGPDADRLIISKDGEPLPTKRISDTAVKHFVRKPDLQISKYVCIDDNTGYNTSVIIKVVPVIYFQSGNERITPYFSKLFHKYRHPRELQLQNYYLQYDESLQMFCSGPRPVQIFGIGKSEIDTKNHNETTVKLAKDIKLGTMEFGCRDSEFSDHTNTIRVIVTPRIEIKSSNKRYLGKWMDGFTDHYSIKYGDSLETICYGPNGTKLTLRLPGTSFKEHHDIVNRTSVNYVTKSPEMDEGLPAECFIEDCSRRSGYRRKCSMESYNKVRVYVLPVDITDFRCVSYDEKRLNCSWTTASEVNFTLSEVNVNNEMTRICEVPRSSTKSKSCVWEYEFEYEHTKKKLFNFLLRTCNFWGVCIDQTFLVNHASVMKIAAPEGLTVVSRTPHGAVVRWNVIHLYRGGRHFNTDSSDCDHKIEYSFSNTKIQVNSSMVICDEKHCNIELDLPCPGQFYVVEVYRKLKMATGEEFWSDPRPVKFRTDLEKGYNVMKHAACILKPKQNPYVMQYFVQVLQQEVQLKMQTIKEEIRQLKDKLASIRSSLQ